jgi:phosphoadenosine phosphosulfate reductase
VKKKKPYLGPLLLAWCDHCNVPLAKRVRCGRCGGHTRPVNITPPGDARPAFETDRKQLIDSISKQYNRRVADQLVPADKIILLNAIPDIDCCEEVIVDGQIIGLHRFRIETLSWEFIPKLEGARRFVLLTKDKQVVIEDSAVKFIVRGANLLRPGVKTADSSISSGDYVIGVTEQGEAILVGIAMMTGIEMQRQGRGMAIKKRYKGEPHSARILPGSQTWRDVLEANSELLDRLEKEAITFIQNTAKEYHLPNVVAFSGGKDSLAVLLLTQKALPNQSFHVMFIDTGIEFPETVENVHSVISSLGLKKRLLIKHVDKDRFFRVLEIYGLVARDYRVCCKTVKLGPTSQLIDEYFPQGCLSFIGQRRYESHRRSAGGRIWKNPWVPKQVGASPIHNWTAMMIWLYLFHMNAPYNPLYEEGFERIGCMFCPASKMSEMELISTRFPAQWNQWYSTAKSIVTKQGLDEKWLRHGFWRWKTPPPKIRELAQKMDIELPLATPLQSKSSISYELSWQKKDKVSKLVVNGRFNTSLNLTRAAAFLPALGDATVDLEHKIIEVKIKGKEIQASLFESGVFTLSGSLTQQDVDQFVQTILRGVLCTSCGTCQSFCANDAISLESGRAFVIKEVCTQCGKCLHGKCPTLYAFQ